MAASSLSDLHNRIISQSRFELDYNAATSLAETVTTTTSVSISMHPLYLIEQFFSLFIYENQFPNSITVQNVPIKLKVNNIINSITSNMKFTNGTLELDISIKQDNITSDLIKLIENSNNINLIKGLNNILENNAIKLKDVDEKILL